MVDFRSGQKLYAADLNGVSQAMQRIDEQVLSQNTQLVTFPEISQDFRHLQLILHGGHASSGFTDVFMILNSDDAGNSNYRWFVTGRTIGATFDEASNDTGGEAMGIGRWSEALRGNIVAWLPDYTNTSGFKTVNSTFTCNYGSGMQAGEAIGERTSTEAITRVEVRMSGGVDMLSGSTFSLYGLR